MLIFLNVKNLHCPYFICAACGKPLTTPGLQMAAYDMREMDNEPGARVQPVHKGRCLNILEAKIEGDGGMLGTIELDDFIANLLHNSGYEGPKGEQWEGLGTLYLGGPFKARARKKRMPFEYVPKL